MKEKIYLPTAAEAILIPFLTLFVLLISNSSLIRRQYLEGETTAIATNYVSSLTHYLDNPVINNSGVFVFWMMVGAVGYAIVAGLGIIIHSYTSDITLYDYVRPAEGRAEKKEKFLRFVLRSMALFGLLAWSVGTIWFVLPWVDTMFAQMFTGGSVLVGVMAYSIAVLCLFIPIFLLRLFLLRTRVYEPENSPF